MVRAILDDRLTEERDGIDTALTRRSLSPHPSLLLVLEGRTELLLMPQQARRALRRVGSLDP